MNHQKYINRDKNGKVRLIEYAQLYIYECGLIFDFKIKSVNKYGEQFYKKCVLFRVAASNITFEAHYSDDNKDNQRQEKMMREFNTDILDINLSLTLDEVTNIISFAAEFMGSISASRL